MKSLSQLLGAAGRTDVLRTLVYLPEPVGLRQVARLAGVHPHTAELVLADLVRDGLVCRRRSASRVFFSLVRTRDDVAVLEAVFSAADGAMARIKSRGLSARAAGLLPFMCDARRLITRAKEGGHVA